MPNDYFTATGSPATRSSGSSSVIRALFTALQTAFDKFPSLTSKQNQVVHVNSGSTGLTSTSGFTFDGTTLTVPKIAAAEENSIAGIGTYSCRGLRGVNNSGTPNTQYDVVADEVVLITPSTGIPVRKTNTGTKTNNVSTAGPAAGGRDQAGAFSSSSWIHFYWIWDGTTLSTVSSATAPPTGPTLPSGYTHWAYIGAVYFDGSSHLTATYIRGSKVFYKAVQSALSGGTSTSYASVSLTSLVPSNALTFDLAGVVSGTFANNDWASISLTVSVDGTNNLGASSITAENVNSTQTLKVSGSLGELPNVSQTVYYIITPGIQASSANSASLNILSYRVPNGGE